MSEFQQEKKPAKINWLLAKQNQKERIIQISETEIDIMFSWYEQYTSYSLRGKEHSKTAIVRLENGPLGKKVCDFWIMLSELKIINSWYEIVKNPTDEDKRVFKIIDDALNPKELVEDKK